jgi:hypothetical protein
MEIRRRSMMRADAMSDASPRTASPPVRWRGSALVSCSPCAPALSTAFLRPALRRPDCRCWPEQMITLLARWKWCRGARSVARRVLCAAPDAALRVPCVVPDVVLLVRFAVPAAAPYQTSPYLWAAAWAWRASWWFGLQPVKPAEL